MAEEVIKFRVERELVPLGSRFAGADGFRFLFDEGMALVEQTADYLEGDGRRDSLRLSRTGALAYASESMRLTTRLMQIASWLLLQRAVNDGELSDEQARAEKDKVRLTDLAPAMQSAGWEGLPHRLRSLIVRSLRLQERLQRLDGAFGPSGPPKVVNPVGEQIVRIADALAARR